MKLPIKSNKTAKADTKTAAKATKSAAKAAPEKSGITELASYATKHVKEVLKAGLDGAGAWLGKSIADPLVTALITNREKISSTRLAKTDKVLFVQGSKAFAWKLSGLSGDIYERAHDGKTPVRGLVSSLQKTYGAKNARIVSVQEATKLLKTMKADAACAKAFGIA